MRADLSSSIAHAGKVALLMVLLCVALLASTQSIAEADAPKFKPALLYQSGGNGMDSSFIHSAAVGISKAEKEFGIRVRVVQVAPNADMAAMIQRVASEGVNPILLLGAQNVEPVLKLAPRYPHTQFTVIDGLTPPIFPNVQSILFKDNEGAFLVGMIAGKMSRTGFVGFIGGMDIPTIRNFATGFAQGVKYAAPDVEVNQQMVGNTPDAWSNPEKAKNLALMQYREGADIVFAAAGGSSLGVLKAADQMGKYAIGVDSNQNGLFPGHVLTSLVKRVDIAVYETLHNSKEGSWSAGLKYLGLKEGALDYAVDQYNSALISERLIEDVATARDKIIAGTLNVDSYTAK